MYKYLYKKMFYLGMNLFLSEKFELNVVFYIKHFIGNQVFQRTTTK